MFLVGEVSGLLKKNNLQLHSCDKGQSVHDGITHWSVPDPTSFSDLDCISRLQQCQTAVTENVMFLCD